MDSITRNAYAKINLSLDVTGRRPDGYHTLRSIMQTIRLFDDITVERTGYEGIEIASDSLEIPAGPVNIAWRAADAMLREFGITAGVSISITKRIPVAAGLAGGSTDAAAVMLAMNELFDLGASKERLDEIAVRLGADVPFCLRRGTYLAEGIGEKLTRIDWKADLGIILVTPSVEISTKWCYEAFDTVEHPLHPDVDAVISAMQAGDTGRMIRTMGNSLEPVTAGEHEEIGQLKQLLAGAGADGVMMSGSGPTVFGIFTDCGAAEKAFDALRPELDRMNLRSLCLTVPVFE